MKTKVLQLVEVNVTHIKIHVPVCYEEEDIPNDFPLRKGDVWEAKVNIDTGAIEGWPTDPKWHNAVINNMKVCDEGTYILLDGENVVAAIEQNYIPNGVVPGEYGDYISLRIVDGVITNWPKNPDVSAFFPKQD